MNEFLIHSDELVKNWWFLYQWLDQKVEDKLAHRVVVGSHLGHTPHSDSHT